MARFSLEKTEGGNTYVEYEVAEVYDLKGALDWFDKVLRSDLYEIVDFEASGEGFRFKGIDKMDRGLILHFIENEGVSRVHANVWLNGSAALVGIDFETFRPFAAVTSGEYFSLDYVEREFELN